MINSCVYNTNYLEVLKINNLLHELAAKYSDEQWKINSFPALNELSDYLKDRPLVDLFIFSLSIDEDIEKLADIRKYYGVSHLLIMADDDMSPMKYIRPGINAQSLLLKPCDDRQAYEVMRSFVEGYLGAVSEDDSVFSITSENGRINIPYNQIFYFEALEKKLYVRTAREEYCFNGTLKEIEKKLPKEFVRCHRSYIVNTGKIRNIALSKNIIYLENENEVPLSRSYKSEIKKAGGL